jgi:hypothetical protein
MRKKEIVRIKAVTFSRYCFVLSGGEMSQALRKAKADPFVTAYLEAALWSSTDNNDTPLDSNYTIHDLSLEAHLQAASDCNAFRAQAGQLLDNIDESQAGHDFWLTRNHHGAGFWDRGLGEIGETLTKLSHKFKELTPVIGADKKIYFE